jgi:hypothetical protein
MTRCALPRWLVLSRRSRGYASGSGGESGWSRSAVLAHAPVAGRASLASSDDGRDVLVAIVGIVRASPPPGAAPAGRQSGAVSAPHPTRTLPRARVRRFSPRRENLPGAVVSSTVLLCAEKIHVCRCADFLRARRRGAARAPSPHGGGRTSKCGKHVRSHRRCRARAQGQPDARGQA